MTTPTWTWVKYGRHYRAPHPVKSRAIPTDDPLLCGLAARHIQVTPQRSPPCNQRHTSTNSRSSARSPPPKPPPPPRSPGITTQTWTTKSAFRGPAVETNSAFRDPAVETNSAVTPVEIPMDVLPDHRAVTNNIHSLTLETTTAERGRAPAPLPPTPGGDTPATRLRWRVFPAHRTKHRARSRRWGAGS